uniref:Uncharacterized protein n=1 Tax=Anguilla anguilla TaxID=7936 RepID=A0A0E9XG21_ANGAN
MLTQENPNTLLKIFLWDQMAKIIFMHLR